MLEQLTNKLPSLKSCLLILMMGGWLSACSSDSNSLEYGNDGEDVQGITLRFSDIFTQRNLPDDILAAIEPVVVISYFEAGSTEQTQLTADAQRSAGNGWNINFQVPPGVAFQFELSWQLDDLVIARVIRQFDQTQTGYSQQLTIPENEYDQSMNADSDSFTNFEELEGNSDPYDGSSRPDRDGDGFTDDVDNCLNVANPNQDPAACSDIPLNDGDGDGIADDMDNCLGVPNAEQLDTNSNSTGNACDAGVLTFRQSTFTVDEGEVFQLDVFRDHGGSGEGSVRIELASGSATVFQDFFRTDSPEFDFVVASLGDVRPGSDSPQVSLPVTIASDSDIEGDETFTVRLVDLVGVQAGSITTATVTIRDRSQPVEPAVISLESQAYEVAEGQNLTIPVLRTGNSDVSASVVLTIESTGSALQGQDFVLLGDSDPNAMMITLQFPSGIDQNFEIAIDALMDTDAEGPEEFFISLSEFTGANAGSITTATVIITNTQPREVPSVTIDWISPTDAPVIDGLYDSIWDRAVFNDDNGNRLWIDNLMIDNGSDMADGQPSYYWAALHDDFHLYLFVGFDSVSAGHRFGDSGNEYFRDDNLNIYLDGNFSGGNSYDGFDDTHMFIKMTDASGGPANPSTLPVLFSLPSIKSPIVFYAVCHCTSGIDTWEVIIELESVGIVPNQTFGIDLQIDQDLDGGDRDAKWGWAHPSGSDTTWTTPSIMGTAILR